MKLGTGLVLFGILVVAACHPSRGGHAAAGALAASHAVMPAPASLSEASAFLVIGNRGDAPVTFIGALSTAADSVVLHRLVGGMMQPAAPLVIPAHGHVNFVPGGYHLMLEGLRRRLAIGDTVTLTLRCDSGDTLAVKVPVLNYTEAVSELPVR